MAFSYLATRLSRSGKLRPLAPPTDHSEASNEEVDGRITYAAHAVTPRLMEGAEATFTSSASLPPELPQELRDYIVDFLHDDKPSLVACILAGRPLLAPARYHLFAYFRVPERRLSAFLRFAARSPHICVHARSLCLIGEPPQFPDPRLRTAVTPRFLAYLFGLLPNIKKLDMFSMRFRDCVDADADSRFLPASGLTVPAYEIGRSDDGLPAGFKLDNLTLRYAGSHWDHTPEDFIALLNAFTEIKKLYINILRLRRPAVPAPAEDDIETWSLVLPAHLAVHTLAINDTAPLTNFYLRLIKRMCKPELRELKVQCRQPWEVSALGALLRVVGGHLEDLNVDLSSILEPPEATRTVQICDELCLGLCTNLSSFTLCAIINPYTPEPLSWRSICGIVASLSNTPVRRMTLWRALDLNAPGSLDWGPMREAVMRFRALETLTFIDPLLESTEVHQCNQVLKDRLAVHSRPILVQLLCTGY